jgi:hypothetical protein
VLAYNCEARTFQEADAFTCSIFRILRVFGLEGDLRTSKRLHESLGKHVRLMETALKREREKVTIFPRRVLAYNCEARTFQEADAFTCSIFRILRV